MKMLNIPQNKQIFEYDCGATVLQSILTYYGINIRTSEIFKIAGTTQVGTPIEGMIKTLENFGLETTSKQMTIEEVKSYLSKKIPVILLLQAWTKQNKSGWKNKWSDGHYVIAIGFSNDKIIFEDPATFNHTCLNYSELKERWHDIDNRNGKKYHNLGIAIFGKKPVYERKKIIHMD